MLQPVISEHKMGFSVIENRHAIEGQLTEGEEYFQATNDHCDCGTALGCAAPSRRRQTRGHKNLDRKIKHFKKKGWSEAKIQRWTAQQQETAEKAVRVADQEIELRWAEGEEWLKFVKDMLDSGHASSVGLLLNWNHIVIKSRKSVALKQASPRTFLEMEEDVLYEFRR